MSGPLGVRIPPGSTNVSFNIAIYNDNVLERNESFFFNVHALSDGLLKHNPPLAIVNIIDTTG